MKITDTTGRSMLVDLVYKDQRTGWLQAPEYTLKGRGTRFVQVPHGQYAIRIVSPKCPADVIVFENGERLIATTVTEGKQFVSNDAENQPLAFGTARKSKVTDVAVLADTTESMKTEEGSTESAPALNTAIRPLQPIAGPGMVFVVIRFAKQNSPYGEPPQEEFEVAFQMLENAEFENHMANNMHLVNQAPPLPNPRDPMSREKADYNNDGHSHFNCVFSGHRH
ncbi:MAG TPA: hypothetical protein V6C81_12450 [Planktothrix sp.]|jgi:hypothetical protein